MSWQEMQDESKSRGYYPSEIHDRIKEKKDKEQGRSDTAVVVWNGGYGRLIFYLI